jgi:prolipoprotein diacylglyceryltransferase
MLPVLGVLWVPSLPAWGYALLLGALLLVHWLFSRWGALAPIGATLAALLISWLSLRHLPTEPVVVHSFAVVLALSVLLGFAFFLWLSRASSTRREEAEVILAAAVVGFLAGFGALRAELGDLSLLLGMGSGALYAIWFARYRGLDWRPLMNAASLSALVALTLGRLACFLHGCDFGAPTDSFLAVTYPAEWPNLLHPEGALQSPISLYQHSDAFAQRYPQWVEWLAAYDDRSQGAPLSLPVHPLPLYEALGCALLLGTLLLRQKKREAQNRLDAARLALVGYAALRLLADLFRGDDEPRYASLTATQWISITIIVGFVLWRIFPRRKT